LNKVLVSERRHDELSPKDPFAEMLRNSGHACLRRGSMLFPESNGSWFPKVQTLNRNDLAIVRTQKKEGSEDFCFFRVISYPNLRMQERDFSLQTSGSMIKCIIKKTLHSLDIGTTGDLCQWPQKIFFDHY